MNAKKKHRAYNFMWMICILASLCIGIGLCPAKTGAETVTDTITIKVGYWGMQETDYVTKAEYHWTQLQKDLPVYEQAYSYFRDKENRSYATIVAAARGFYLEDLLNYAGVNISDVKNISFYTNDYAAGAFTSFTPYQLLSEPRYYYDNLASHINNEFNDAGILTGYTVDPSAYDNRERVQTMLALESNWESFEAGTENTNPVFTGLSTSSRFRLLFGQTEPTEMRTSQSAKYVHTIALTIPGSPEVRGSSGDYTGKIMLSRQIGRHTVSFYVGADEAMLETIKQKLVWTSSDDRILRIDGVSMDKSAEFDDAVEVRIDYEVLKEGNATINGNFMGMALSGAAIETEEKSTEDDDNGGSGSGGSSGSSGAKKPASSGSTQGRRLSLTDHGGTVANAQAPEMITAAEAAAQAQGGDSGLVPMDLGSVFDTEEVSSQIAVSDQSGKYAPVIYGSVGVMLLMGGLASMLQFKAQLGQLALPLRRRRI